MNAAATFVRGFSALPSAVWFLFRRRDLWGLCAAPLAIGAGVTLVLCGGSVAGWIYAYRHLLPPESQRGVVFYAGAAAGALLLSVVVALLFTTIAATGAGPWLERLSAKIESERTTGSPTPDPVRSFAQRLAGQLLPAAGFVATAVAALPLLCIPIAGPVSYAVAAALAGSFALGWSAMEYVWGRHGFSTSDRLAYVRSHLAAMLGLGLASWLATFVPCLPLALLPPCAVAATSLWCDRDVARPTD